MVEFDYVDDIHFIAIQLNKYYNCGKYEKSWPWRTIADAVGCSVTTVRKYCTQDWLIDSLDKNKIIVEKINSLDLTNNEIKFLTPQTYKFFLNKETYTIEKAPEPHLTKSESIAAACEKLPTKKPIYYTNNISVQWPSAPGVYLLCQIACRCNEPQKRFMLVKIGKSVNLHQRISSYFGTNPFAKCIDIQECSKTEVDNLEIKYHQLMDKQYDRQGNTEWFVVPEEDYLNILKYGFDFFRNPKNRK